MKIYEMIFNKGIYEHTNLFYSNNNESSRKHFIEYISLELNKELESFKLSCMSKNNKDLLFFFIEIYKESFTHINLMADDFIKNEIAKFDECIYLKIEEHDLID